jgi:hypothetical protein
MPRLHASVVVDDCIEGFDVLDEDAASANAADFASTVGDATPQATETRLNAGWVRWLEGRTGPYDDIAAAQTLFSDDAIHLSESEPDHLVYDFLNLVTAQVLPVVEARAAMGAVVDVDVRDSAMFHSLLAAGNLLPPFLTLPQPHDEADTNFGSSQDKELLDHLEGMLATESVVVKRDQRIVPLDVTLKGKSVSVRADLNAPLDAHQNSTEDIHAIQYLFSKGAKVQRADDVIEPEVEKLVVTLPNRCLTNCFNLVDSCFSWDVVSHRQPWPPPTQFLILGDGVPDRFTPWKSLDVDVYNSPEYKEPWPPPAQFVILGARAWLTVIWQLLELVTPTYAGQLKFGELARFDSYSLFHVFGIRGWGLLAEMRTVSSMALFLSISTHLTNMLVLDGPVISCQKQQMYIQSSRGMVECSHRDPNITFWKHQFELAGSAFQPEPWFESELLAPNKTSLIVKLRMGELGLDVFLGKETVWLHGLNLFAVSSWNMALKVLEEDKYDYCSEFFELATEFFSSGNAEEGANILMNCKTLIMSVSSILLEDTLNKSQLSDSDFNWDCNTQDVEKLLPLTLPWNLVTYDQLETNLPHSLSYGIISVAVRKLVCLAALHDYSGSMSDATMTYFDMLATVFCTTEEIKSSIIVYIISGLRASRISSGGECQQQYKEHVEKHGVRKQKTSTRAGTHVNGL